MFKALIKKIMPAPFLSGYHFALAWLAAIIYGWPSERLKVIGVTGTSGKSTTVHFLRHLLEATGHKVASLSTIDFYLAGQSKLNDRKMTMLGRLATQRFLAAAVKAGCDYAIVETTSQGVLQHRHRFINYDVAVLTNLYPEHLEAHGGFANYKAAKLKFFEQVAKSRRKKNAPKVAVVNGDNDYAKEFLSPLEVRQEFFLKHNARAKPTFVFSFSLLKQPLRLLTGLAAGDFDQKMVFGKGQHSDLTISDIDFKEDNLNFKLNGLNFLLPFLGEFNAYNFAAAAAVAISQGARLERLIEPAAKILPVPGHLEFIDEGQAFKVLVDYAFEPVALAELYKIVQTIKRGRVIHVLGSTGGGRDASRRAVLGKMAGELADLVIVTNEDPYDDDPQTIIDQVAAGIVSAGKKLNLDLFKILDRREAIVKALAQAQPNDLVLVTGKGAEQAICAANGKKIPWDDRMVVRQELKRIT